MAFDPDQLPIPDLGLRCRRCGYPLANLREHRCPECGDVFDMEDYIPEGAYPRLIAGGEEVRASPDIDELFAAYHLPYIRIDSPIQSVFGGLGDVFRQRSHLGPPIAVPRNRYFEAIDLIRRVQLDEELPPTPVAPAEESEMRGDWTCDACGESNPETFEVCWNCQTPRTA